MEDGYSTTGRLGPQHDVMTIEDLVDTRGSDDIVVRNREPQRKGVNRIGRYRETDSLREEHRLPTDQ